MRSLEDMVEWRSVTECDQIAEKFQSAYPFPHLSIDGFFTEDFVADLVAQFPRTDDPAYANYCQGEGDGSRKNYANGDPETFPTAFKALDALSRDKRFLDYISRLTGIENVEFDPDYFGAGLRESRGSSMLPPHLDFNYHPKALSHRRLNFLLYLNPDWDPSWGGNIQMHLDPNTYREKSLVSSFAPLLNRVVLFETSETSWHGFDRLNAPDGLSRRAWSIYYYTRERDGGAEIKRRNTEYVEPPLPAVFSEGHVLTLSDINELRHMLDRRDKRISMLYELRRTFDDRYSHLWNEYEYYLKKHLESQAAE